MWFWNKPCDYCGDAIRGIGLDRIDNIQGYHRENVAPCCTGCNIAKGEQTRTGFIARCQRVAERHEL